MTSISRQLARFLCISGMLVALALAIAAPAWAQSPPPPEMPDPLTKEAIHEMVARMSDDQVRNLLLDRLDAVADGETGNTASVSFVTRAQNLWAAFTLPVTDAVRKLPVLFTKQWQVFGNFIENYGGLGGTLTLLGLIAFVLVIGLAAEFVVGKAINRWRSLSSLGGDDDTLASALGFLARRLIRELLGLMVFYMVIRAVGRLTLDQHQLQFAAPMVTYLIWMPRLGAAISRFLLAPHRADRRLVNASDHWAKFLHRNIIGLIFLAGLTIFAVNFSGANGVPSAETRLGFWLDSMVYVYIIWIAWTAREGLSEMMRGTDPDRTESDENAARLYPYFAMVVAALTWVSVSTLIGLNRTAHLLQGAHYITMFWLLAAPALDTAIRGLVKHLVPPMAGEGKLAEDAYKSTKRSYIRIGRVVVAVIVLMIISNAWDVNLMAMLSDVQGFADNIIGFLMTLAVGYVVYEGVSLWINRRLAQEQTSAAAQNEEEMGGGEGGGAGGSRLATVLPLLLVTAQIGIVVIFGLLAIGALGIDITPLLAGAGILGLAIGFGAQKLVSDVVSGIFFLIDDAFRVGEYVEVDGTMGTVEKISIRSMQLRHHRGLVHTIPYGEIPKLTNYSRDWVIMKLMFTVPFDTDPNKVKKIFKKIGAEMMQEPLFKDDFLEPFKSQGVFQFDDVGIVMRGKFMAKPGTQFTIRKEIYNRVRKEFEANGIEFARREVRVAMPGGEDSDKLSDADKAALAGAAGAAVQQQQEEAQAAASSKDDR